MTPSGLLDRVAATLKKQVGPAVDEEFPKSQAYFSAVVLNKLAAQLRLSEEHSEAQARQYRALAQDLRQLLDDIGSSPELENAYTALVEEGEAGQCRFIEALYAARDHLGDANFAALLGRTRQTMRCAIDRRMEYAS